MSTKTNFSHYYKKVPDGVTHLDVYWVLELFEVYSPPLQHAIKKMLVAGGRGHKNIEKDIDEAIASLNRWKEMRAEQGIKQNFYKEEDQ